MALIPSLGCAEHDRGISFVLSSVVFHVIPTALEITMVCGILVSGIYNQAGIQLRQ